MQMGFRRHQETHILLWLPSAATLNSCHLWDLQHGILIPSLDSCWTWTQDTTRVCEKHCGHHLGRHWSNTVKFPAWIPHLGHAEFTVVLLRSYRVLAGPEKLWTLLWMTVMSLKLCWSRQEADLFWSHGYWHDECVLLWSPPVQLNGDWFTGVLPLGVPGPDHINELPIPLILVYMLHKSEYAQGDPVQSHHSSVLCFFARGQAGWVT